MVISDTVYYILVSILAVYEVLARVIPTEGNWSILQNVIKILDFIVKNRSTSGSQFTVTKVEQPTTN